MSKSVERYIALHNSAKQQNHDNFMKELKDTFGNLPDKDKIDEIALYLQICVKQSRPLYIHGYLLSSALHKYLLEKQPEKINILDIGTARGFSAIVMSNILKNNNIDGKIYTIDILGHYEKRKWNSIDCPNDQKISRNEILERWSYLRDNYIEFIKGNSVDILKSLPVDRIHVAFVDGDHTYNTVIRELNQVETKQLSGDIILCDDYTVTQFPEICKAIDEFLSMNKYEYKIFYGTDGIKKRGYVYMKKK